jgi:hypothetical protein
VTAELGLTVEDAGGAARVPRVLDRRTRCLTEIPAVRRHGLLRMCVHLPCGTDRADITDVRALLVGDLLFRALEARGAQMHHTFAAPRLGPEKTEDLHRVMTAFGIHPPEAEAVVRSDIHVVAGGQHIDDAGVWIEVGQAWREPAAKSEPLVRGTEGETDPLAVRLALLSCHYRASVGLTPDLLAAAERALSAWRGRVAGWADAPSRPVPRDVRAQAEAAFADDLGTPGVLEVLRRVEAAETVPDGAKFETFALLDRVLGLELTREVGRV